MKITNGPIHKSLIYSLIIFGLINLPASATEITHRGDAYVVYLPANLKFQEVVDRVHSEVLGENWQVVHELDVGMTVQEYDKHTDNRIISVCKSQYLAQAIEEDPFVSLIIPCRFTVFREPASNGGSGQIVVGFYDPVAEAKGLELKQAHAAEKATEELKAILQRVAEAFEE